MARLCGSCMMQFLVFNALSLVVKLYSWTVLMKFWAILQVFVKCQLRVNYGLQMHVNTFSKGPINTDSTTGNISVEYGVKYD